MRRRFAKKVVGLTLTAAMVASLAACNNQASTNDETSKEETKKEETSAAGSNETTSAAQTDAPTEEETTLYKDANGNTVDLGGMKIIIRDWWSDPVDSEPKEPNNAFEEARQEYIEWIQKTYNFTIQQAGISTWASVPEDFNNYVSTGGDDENYIFVLRRGTELAAAMNADLMYDLTKLDCLDFSDPKWVANVKDTTQKGSAIYGMSAETIEPKAGMYFNKRLLKEAGIDPESIYTLQENMEWTWDKFEEICKQINKDTDGDGEIDRYAMVNFGSTFYNGAVMSNNAHFIGKDADGKFYNALETQETLDALNWAVDMLATYDYPQPADSNWDYWVEAFVNGKGAFIAGETYQAGQEWKDMEDDFGFVCFPMGPNAKDYTNWLGDNVYAIPSCYDADRAWKLAFAYNLYSSPVPGFEDYNGRIEGFNNNFRDAESVDLTINRLYTNGSTTYHDLVPGIQMGPDLIWGLSKDNTPAQKAEAIRDTWAAYIEEANK